MKRRILIISLSVAALLVALVFAAGGLLKNTVRSAIEKGVESIGATASVGRISVNLPARSVTVRDLHVMKPGKDAGAETAIVPDTSAVVSVDATIRKISVRGLHYKKTDGRPSVRASSLVIDSPQGSITTGKRESPTPRKPLRQALAEKVSSLTVGNISITGAGFDLISLRPEGDTTRLWLGGGNIGAKGFSLDPLSSASEKKLFSDDLHMTADSIVYGLSGGDRRIRIDSLIADAAKSTLSARHLALIPRFPKYEFAQRSREHTDWTEVSLDDIVCTGVDFAGLINDKTIVVDSVSLAGGHIASYKNRNFRQSLTIKPMLWQTIQRLPVALDVRRVSFLGLDIEYDELAQGHHTPGIVTLWSSRGTVSNLTNIAEGHDRFFTIDMSALLMKSGRMDIACRFPVAASDNHWEMTGKVGRAGMAAFNRALEPLLDVRITSGVMRSLVFNLTGTNERSHIHLIMAYDDLLVEILRKDDRAERKFLTFLADDILIRRDNPGRYGKLHEAEGNHEHDPRRSMYNFIWRSFVPAIVKTVL